METTTSTATDNGQSFISKYGLWIALAIVLLIGFANADKIKSMLGMGETKMPSASSGSNGIDTQQAPAVATPAAQPKKIVGNDYVSGDAINKVLLGNYEKYKVLIPEGTKRLDSNKKLWEKYDGYWGKIDELFGPAKDNEPAVSAFLKGMNLAWRPDYVAIFKDYIQEYINNPAHLSHWEVAVGQFLKPGGV